MKPMMIGHKSLIYILQEMWNLVNVILALKSYWFSLIECVGIQPYLAVQLFVSLE